MESEFLKIDGIYSLCYADGRNRYVRVLNVFPNNFIEVWCRDYVDFSLLKRSQLDRGWATRMFINLSKVEDIRELPLRD